MKKLYFKRFLGVIGFCLVFIFLSKFYFEIAQKSISIQGGLDTTGQLTQQYTDVFNKSFDCLIVGNSRTYRGINPSFLEKSTYNYSHDNDNYNQIYWKLMGLDREKVSYDTLILSTDYFMFSFLADSRNSIYQKLLPSEYMLDYGTDAVENTDQGKNQGPWYKKLDDDFTAYIVRRFQMPFSYIKSFYLSGDDKDTNIPYLKSNGQYIVPNLYATDTDTITRTSKRLDIQEMYFEKILKFCYEKGISVVIVMPPTRDAELSSYTSDVLNEFDGYLEKTAQKYNALILNYAFDKDFKATSDYMDITHLTPAAADRWTMKLNEDLIKDGVF